MTMKVGRLDVAARFCGPAIRDAVGRSSNQQRSKTFTRCISTRELVGRSAAKAPSCATSANHKEAQKAECLRRVPSASCASSRLTKQNARHGRHTGRKSQEEPSVMVVAILAAIRLTSSLRCKAGIQGCFHSSLVPLKGSEGESCSLRVPSVLAPWKRAATSASTECPSISKKAVL